MTRLYCRGCDETEDCCLCNHECVPDFEGMTIGGSKGIIYLETNCKRCGVPCEVAVGHEEKLDWDFRER